MNPEPETIWLEVERGGLQKKNTKLGIPHELQGMRRGPGQWKTLKLMLHSNH